MRNGSAEAPPIKLGGALHDIGKIGIPDRVLGKTSKLDDQEYELIKQHPSKGGRILEGIKSVKLIPILPCIVHHHESYDGSGYPDGLVGDDIPVLARIISIADTFDAMTTDRPYRKGLDVSVAIAELQKCAGSQFDLKLVHEFVAMIRETGLKI